MRDHESTADDPRHLTRRGVLAAGVGLLAAGCGSAAKRALGPTPVGGTGTAPGAEGPTSTTVAPQTPAASPTTQLTSVPVVPVAPRRRPAFYVDQVLTTAAPSAVALTIDDGPDPTYTPAVLALLAKYGIVATFSVIGRQALRYPALLREIVAHGHTLANHSMTHPQPFANLSPARIQAEVVGCLEAIHAATGNPPTAFRSPGGDWSPGMFDLLGELGMTPIDWDVDPRDWSRPGTAFITSRLLAARPHDILLCHDGGGNRSETVAALRTVLPALRARGLTFVAL